MDSTSGPQSTIAPNPQGEEQTAAERELGRLLDAARGRGALDAYKGKRSSLRYRYATRLELSVGPPGSGPIRAVIMHDISAGGCGFWFPTSIPQHTTVFLREYSSSGDRVWLQGVVRHCTSGVAGHRIGLSFSGPLEGLSAPQDDDHADARVRSPKAMAEMPIWSRGSLRARALAASAAAALLGLTVASTICTYGWPGVSWVEASMLGFALSLGFAGVLIPLVLQGHLKGLRDLQAEILALARGDADSPGAGRSRSEDLARAQRALAQLRGSWRKRKEWENNSRQRLESVARMKSNLLSTVSHDLRTPLTEIMLRANMLEDQLRILSVDDQRRFLRVISEQCARLSSLVEGVLDAQRLESDRVDWRIEPIDLTNVLRSCHRTFRELAESKGIAFSLDCSRPLPHVEADSEQITHVVGNLVDNAMKHTPTGGRVRVSAAPDADGVLICVEDTGPGIPRERWDKIFDRFAKLPSADGSETPGVGLGLHIVRQIVDRHGGRTWVDSEVGHGAKFYVALPKSMPVDEPEGSERLVEKKAGTVLACDPDPELADRMRQVLRRAGFEVQLAHSGCRLLALLQRKPAEVVVTDILLPDMDAHDLLQGMKAKSELEFGVVIHSYSGEGEVLRRQGADVFLERPAKSDDLIEAVKVALQKARNTGPVVLVIGPPAVSNRVQSELLQGGYTPVLAATMAAAVEKLNRYSFNAVFVSNDVLDSSWRGLAALHDDAGVTPPMLVMCKQIRRAERRRAEKHGVGLLHLKAGKEQELLASIREAMTESMPQVET